VNILKDAEKNILYEHISRALKAVDEEDPVTIIRELYHVIEKNTPIHLKKFCTYEMFFRNQYITKCINGFKEHLTILIYF
jgi:hypothetical protein